MCIIIAIKVVYSIGSPLMFFCTSVAILAQSPKGGKGDTASDFTAEMDENENFMADKASDFKDDKGD